jgi:predicted membrane-bound spermidine synthase
VIWTRQLNLLLGNSVYGFSLMLGAYLAGIGVGSVAFSHMASRVTRPLFVFSLFELLIAFFALASLRLILEIGLRDTDPRYTYSQIWSFSDFLRLSIYSVLIVGPLALLLGAIFPIATRLVSDDRLSPEESIGKLYGYNTVGAILGSGLTGFVLIPLLGTLNTFLVTSALSLGLGMLLLALSGRVEGKGVNRGIALGAGLAFVVLLSTSFRDPMLAILESRVDKDQTLLAHEEGRGASVTLFHGERSGHNTLYINGLYVSNTSDGLGSLLVEMPLAFHPAPTKSLIIGLGAGEAFRSAIKYGTNTTVVELLPNVVDLFVRFPRTPEHYLDNPLAKVVINDGRNFLLGSDEKYDLIVVDGVPPVFAAGMVNLYSYEFTQLAKERLTPDGIYTLFFPLVCFEDDFWGVVRNFADTFPSVQIVTGAPQSAFAIVLGSPASPPKFEPSEGELFERLRSRGMSTGAENAARNLKRAMLFSPDEIRRRVARYRRVTDDEPSTEFPLARFARGEKYLSSGYFLYEYAASIGTTNAPVGSKVDP